MLPTLVPVLCCAAVGTAVASWATESAGQPPRRYGGRTLTEWREQFKVLDPRSDAARQAVPGLVAIIRDPEVEWFTRRQAALALGRIGRPAASAVPSLAALLEGDDPDPTVLGWACQALALFGPEAASATPVLLSIARDSERPLDQRAAALEALSAIGPADSRVIPALIGLLSEPGPQSAALRGLTADSLAVIGPAAAPAVPALLRAAGDPDEMVRGKVFAALGAMRSQAEPAIAALLEALVIDESAAVRDAAAESLARIGHAAVPPLTGILDQDDPEVRWRAAQSLGRIGRRAAPAQEALRRLFKDRDPRVRLYAAEACWKIAADAPRVLPVILEGLAADRRDLRMQAFRLLVSMGPPAADAKPALQRLLDDPRPHVRTAAASALRQLAAFEAAESP